MNKIRLSRRDFLRISGLAASAALVSACVPAAAPTAAPTVVVATVAPTEVPTTAPTETPTAAPTKYSESPVLAELVKAGKLPPVDERLPKEPRIQPTVENIGQYSNRLTLLSIGPGQGWDLGYSLMVGMFGETNDGQLFANFAKDLKISDDSKTFTIYLREGLKWSDGEPFTTADVKFWYEDDFLNTDLNPTPPSFGWTPGGNIPKLDIIDDYTFSVTWDVPNRPFRSALMFWAGMWWNFASGTPAHYMKKYHIKYNPEVETEAKNEGFDYWYQYYGNRKNTMSGKYAPEKPALAPWVAKEYTDTYMLFVRNPYYWGVDSAGNQLPYFDEVMVLSVPDAESYNLKVVAGDADFACVHATLNNLPLYMENAEKGGYVVYKYKSPRGSDEAYTFSRVPKDEALASIYNDLRWNMAMSYAINRTEVKEVVFLGTGVERQAAPNPEVSYFKKEWEDFCVEFDQDKANQLLDELGLDKRDGEGYRLRPDGQTLAPLIELTTETDSPTLDVTKLVSDHWKEAGVKVDYKVITRELLQTRALAGEVEIGVWHVDRTNEPRAYIPNVTKLLADAADDYAFPSTVLWYQWWRSKGEQGVEPPEEWKEYFQKLDDWHATTSDDDYKRLAEELFDFVILKQLRVIGTVGFTTWPVIVKKDIGNIPAEGYMGDDVGGPRSLNPECWFRKQA